MIISENGGIERCKEAFHVKKLSVTKDYTTQKDRIEYVDVRKFDEDGIYQAYKLALELHYKEKNKVI